MSPSGLEGVGTFPKSWTEEGFHWGKVSVYRSTNIERPATICTPTDKCLDCGVKLEYPKRTQADTELAYTKGHNSTQTVATIGYSCAVQRSRAFWKKKKTHLNTLNLTLLGHSLKANREFCPQLLFQAARIQPIPPTVPAFGWSMFYICHKTWVTQLSIWRAPSQHLIHILCVSSGYKRHAKNIRAAGITTHEGFLLF